MVLIARENVQDSYDLVLAGSGFGAMFFLHGFLERRPDARCLILEWGDYRDHTWQLQNQRNSDINHWMPRRRPGARGLFELTLHYVAIGNEPTPHD